MKQKIKLLTEKDIRDCVFGINETQIRSAVEELNKLLIKKNRRLINFG